ncbi:hypothetical protein F511_19297 [Dorcoceras hygrometricum]|uniref:Uncharacterized protein n=1 Tax=Dorcoceras hygrometricum TaxID=472368 RepID=A0A2Z7A708_9LAMI|nr:hypothetical protein F511_19297 [Dorcoceras hygrometricum]
MRLHAATSRINLARPRASGRPSTHEIARTATTTCAALCEKQREPAAFRAASARPAHATALHRPAATERPARSGNPQSAAPSWPPCAMTSATACANRRPAHATRATKRARCVAQGGAAACGGPWPIT